MIRGRTRGERILYQVQDQLCKQPGNPNSRDLSKKKTALQPLQLLANFDSSSVGVDPPRKEDPALFCWCQCVLNQTLVILMSQKKFILCGNPGINQLSTTTFKNVCGTLYKLWADYKLEDIVLASES